MNHPFTWKVTGWFMVGWSPEFPIGEAHCKHLGAHIGHGGTVVGDLWDDLNIWRYQHYVEHPALSKVDAKPYMALRKWATQFYDVPPTATASA